MPSMKETKETPDERRMHARCQAQKRYRQKNRELLNTKARERAARARALLRTLAPEVQEEKHTAKSEAAQRYRER
ncbi:hypothetical protein H0H92_000696 [Tricholoma furcatifolium]|nr:hypothetical protein H0H92_000696 [Tricholoma furcatifolium]